MRTLLYFTVIAALSVCITARFIDNTDAPLVKTPQKAFYSGDSPIVRRISILRKDLRTMLRNFEEDHNVAVHAYNINLEVANQDVDPALVPFQPRIIENDPDRPGQSDFKDSEGVVTSNVRNSDLESETVDSLIESGKDVGYRMDSQTNNPGY